MKLYRITSTAVFINIASCNKVQLPCYSPTIICILDVNYLSWVALNPKAEIVLLVSTLLLMKSAKISPEVSQMRRPTALEGLKTMDILNILHTCGFDLVSSVSHILRWIRNWWASGLWKVVHWNKCSILIIYLWENLFNWPSLQVGQVTDWKVGVGIPSESNCCSQSTSTENAS